METYLIAIIVFIVLLLAFVFLAPAETAAAVV